MTKSRVIVFTYDDITDYVREKYYLDALENDFDFEYYNLAPLLRLNTKYVSKGNTMSELVSTIERLNNILPQNKSNYILNIIPIKFYPNDVLNILRGQQNKLFSINPFFFLGNIPYQKISLIQQFKINRGIFFKRLKEEASHRFTRPKLKLDTMLISPVAKNIKCLEYDKLCSLQKPENLTSNKYIVYIDQNMTGHEDLKVHGQEAISEKLFYRYLDHYFTKVEKYYGMKVVIALHPKNTHSNLYGSRITYANQTLELCRKSKLILGHWSTSLNYGVLFHKQIILLYNSDIKNRYRMGMYVMRKVSFLTNCALQDLESDINDKPIDEQAYAYCKMYLTNDNSQIENSEAIKSIIKSL